MDKKLTDSEIIKALEGAYKIEPTTMFFITDYNTNKISTIAIGDIVDLINRQKAEIERLEKRLETVQGAKCVYSYDGETIEYCVHSPCPISKTVDQIKTEAYKEFAEKANEIIDLIIDLMFDDSVSKCQLPSCHKPQNIPCENEICIQENKEYWHSKLDNLLKELAGEDQ